MFHFFLTGSPGIGKTTIAEKLRIISEIERYPVEVIHIDQTSAWADRPRPALHGIQLESSEAYTEIRLAAVDEAIKTASATGYSCIIEGSQLVVSPDPPGTFIILVASRIRTVRQYMARATSKAQERGEVIDHNWLTLKEDWIRMIVAQFSEESMTLIDRQKKQKSLYVIEEMSEISRVFRQWLTQRNVRLRIA